MQLRSLTDSAPPPFSPAEAGRSPDEPPRHSIPSPGGIDAAECLRLARRGGEALLLQRTPTTMGVRFPSVEDAEKRDKYGAGLYDGAAGVGIVLLDLFRATGDRRFRHLDDRIEEGLVGSTARRGALEPGLFDGYSGIALHHLARARALRDRDALARALELGVRLASAPLVSTDVISGAAGAGLLQLALYHACGDPVFLGGARRAFAFLAETAVPDGDAGLTWPGHDPRQPLPEHASTEYRESALQHYTGLAHGTAGICLFLLEYAAAARDREAVHLYEEGFRWLDGLARGSNVGICWPRSNGDPGVQAHWCHGSAGISLAYLGLFRETARVDALARARDAAEATWIGAHRREDEPSCHCHGLSGAIELFVEIAGLTSEAVWLERAAALAARIAAAPDAIQLRGRGGAGRENVAPRTFDSRGAGVSVGTAGIVRELLRLAGVPVFPLLLPSRERLRLPAARVRPRSSSDSVESRSDVQLPPLEEARHILPPVGARLANSDLWLVLGVPNDDTTRAALATLRSRPAGVAFFVSLDRVDRACRDLSARYARILAPGALRSRSFGVLLREIAGTCLDPRVDPRRIRNAAARMTAHAIDAMELLLRRLASDVRKEGALSAEVKPPIREIRVVGGDSHRRGQKVVMLRFDDGPVLLYKARSLATDRELAGASGDREQPTLVEMCNRWLEPSIGGGRLPTHRLVAAGTWYGYAEFVSAPEMIDVDPVLSGPPAIPSGSGYVLPPARIACLREDDEKRFWYTSGLVAGFAFTMGAQDLHAENVVCGTSISTPALSPHLVDAEVAFGRVDGLSDTSLIPRPQRRTGSRLHDHCGLSMSLEFDCGLHAEDWVLALAGEGEELSPRLHEGASWRFPHLVRNADGTVGYDAHLCLVLRGIADAWQVLREHAEEASSHLRDTLTGKPARVLRKSTRTYLSELERRKMGGPPAPGSAYISDCFASRLDESELRQLDDLDFPYYFRFLGQELEGRPGTWWMRGREARLTPGPALDAIPLAPPLPFWSVLERQCDPERLARAVTDVVLSVAPTTPFDFRDPSGVRIVRTAEDARIVIAMLIGARRRERLTCRVAQDTGRMEWWLD